VIRFAVAVLFLALNLYVYHWFATDEVIPDRERFAEFPRELGPWHCDRPIEMEAKVLRNLGVTDYLLCTFRRADPVGWVNVYVGYHETQVRREGGGPGENSIHPPKHCLPGSGWDIIAADQVLVDVDGLPRRPALVNRFVTAKGSDRQVVYYWYQSRGRVIAEDWRKIVSLFIDRARRGRTDGSLVRFTIPWDQRDPAEADAVFRSFAPHVIARLNAYVPE